MVKPSANNSQVLVWRPNNGQSVTVVPPKESYKETTTVSIFKGAPTMSRKSHMIRKLTQEVSSSLNTSKILNMSKISNSLNLRITKQYVHFGDKIGIWKSFRLGCQRYYGKSWERSILMLILINQYYLFKKFIIFACKKNHVARTA